MVYYIEKILPGESKSESHHQQVELVCSHLHIITMWLFLLNYHNVHENDGKRVYWYDFLCILIWACFMYVDWERAAGCQQKCSTAPTAAQYTCSSHYRLRWWWRRDTAIWCQACHHAVCPGHLMHGRCRGNNQLSHLLYKTWRIPVSLDCKFNFFFLNLDKLFKKHNKIPPTPYMHFFSYWSQTLNNKHPSKVEYHFLKVSHLYMARLILQFITKHKALEPSWHLPIITKFDIFFCTSCKDVDIFATDTLKQREWDGWAHKPGLTDLSLVHSPGPLWYCVYFINTHVANSTLLNWTILTCWFCFNLCYLVVLLYFIHDYNLLNWFSLLQCCLSYNYNYAILLYSYSLLWYVWFK